VSRQTWWYRWERSVRGQAVEGGDIGRSRSTALAHAKTIARRMTPRRREHAIVRVVRSDGAVIGSYEKTREGAVRRV
jgi:hypothetical protein